MNALRAPLPRACAPVPGSVHAPSPARRPLAGAAGTAHMSFLARPPHQPGCEPDAMHAHRRRRQAANGQRQMDQAGSAAEDASQRRHDGDAAGLRHYVLAFTKASRWPAGPGAT
jgi:hypothetical protein